MEKEGKVSYFIDLENLEKEAHQQILNTASMPFVHHVAVMPDAHFGKGSTVGTVVATKGAIMPACVGVDIGCGMIAVKTILKPSEVQPFVTTLREGIERRIPVGIGPHGKNTKIHADSWARIDELESLAGKQFGNRAYYDERDASWRNALGSLGGGNHFIEVCVGYPLADVLFDGQPARVLEGTQEVWVILHSGSRGVGNKIGTFWTRKALATAKEHMYDSYLPDKDLAWISEKSEDFHTYYKELHWAQEFARLNREDMMDRVLEELSSLTRRPFSGLAIRPAIETERINCHHNYIQKETYFNTSYWITRKGAIYAGEGTKALIPGSMGASSYIVTGKGSIPAMNSAPHGAGRKMSRRKARELFTEDGLRVLMANKNIEARIRDKIVDEHPGSYKDIEQVMNDARDLIEPTCVLTQLLNVKGD